MGRNPRENAAIYEFYIRNAFHVCLRGYDPIHLGDAAFFRSSHEPPYLNLVKIGAAYAMVKNNQEIDSSDLRDPEDFNTLDQLIDRVLKAESGEDVIAAIEDHEAFLKGIASRSSDG